VPVITPLTRNHDRSWFDCDVPELNSFLKATARQHGNKGISRTFVLSEPERPAFILGYFTLTLCEVRTEHFPERYAKKYPSHGLPAVRLARLAVDRKCQRQGYGCLLLADAIRRTILVAEHAGVVGLFVDAKSDSARGFYEKYGFVALRGHESQLFLPIETLLAALSKARL
jgi:ribosomal protein S18 acetylase RimI-like enzyme